MTFNNRLDPISNTPVNSVFLFIFQSYRSTYIVGKAYSGTSNYILEDITWLHGDKKFMFKCWKILQNL